MTPVMLGQVPTIVLPGQRDERIARQPAVALTVRRRVAARPALTPVDFRPIASVAICRPAWPRRTPPCIHYVRPFGGLLSRRLLACWRRRRWSMMGRNLSRDGHTAERVAREWDKLSATTRTAATRAVMTRARDTPAGGHDEDSSRERL
jgi:hypothetical protein